jgi:hypothetical protein
VQVAGLRIVGFGWPLMVIVPGLLFMLAAFSVPRGRGGSYLAVPGCVVLVTGLVLQTQATTGDFQSWSYAWPLIAPASVGLGLLIAGARERARTVRIVGSWLLVAGVVLFVFAEWFFVRVLAVGGPGLGTWFGVVAPLLLVGFGVSVIVRALVRGRRG